MNGIKMDELYELISHCHEAEFEYDGITYVLQPEVNENKEYLVIWDCTPNAEKCIRFLYKGIIIKHNENRANLH